MENRFNNREFEKQLKQHADQFRMFPSEKVWSGIHNALHTRRRWYGIGLALLILTTATVTVVMLTPGERNGKLGHNIGQFQKSSESIQSKPAALAVIAPVRTADASLTHHNYPTRLQESFIAGTNTDNQQELDYNNTDQQDQTTSLLAEHAITSPRADVLPAVERNRIAKSNLSPSKPTAAAIDNLTSSKTSTATSVVTDVKKEEPVTAANNETKKDELIVPFTIESVVNSYKFKSNRRRTSWQIYFTPTISYRNLTENTEFISAARYNSIMNGSGSSPVYYSTDVNSVVNHKPDVGFQLGTRAAFPISKWFSFTAGLQLGVSKYDIQAYNHTSEVATIALTTARAGTNTVSTMSSYRNGDGAKENWLRNFYFSASLPVGMELKLSDGTRNYFGIATTLQPTYVLDNRAYLISTDYKNYAEVPSLTRRWNLSSSFEVFSAHRTGNVQWRVGPQVHYQMMSSFVKNYPIKEHLFDFGLKLGVTLR